MTLSTTTARPSPAQVFHNLRAFISNRMSAAIGLNFAFESLMFGSWVAHIPMVKARLGLDDAQLGLALFGLPLGLLALNPFAARLIARFGLVRSTVGATLFMVGGFALPTWMPDRWSLMAGLAVAGLGAAQVNVCVNTCATTFEKTTGRHIMSSCHGMWSMGGLVGSGMAAVLLAFGVRTEVHLTALAVVLAVAVWFLLRPALRQLQEPERADDGAPGFVWPTKALWRMIFIGLCVACSEGVAFDWSAVYLRDHLGARASVSALAFTGFSCTMMAMRFTGDVLAPRFGARRLLEGSALLSVAALLVLVAAPWPAAGLAGFLLLGAGVALGSPILFNAAARVPGLAPGAGLATYATFSFLGFLAGPPLLGFVGKTFGLPIAFALVAVLVATSLPVIRKTEYT